METIPEGFCRCGCGGRTATASRTVTAYGWFKDRPKPYLPHHSQGVSEQRRQEYRENWKRDRPDIPYGECQCGCGGKTGLADCTDPSSGTVKGSRSVTYASITKRSTADRSTKWTNRPGAGFGCTG